MHNLVIRVPNCCRTSRPAKRSKTLSILRLIDALFGQPQPHARSTDTTCHGLGKFGRFLRGTTWLTMPRVLASSAVILSPAKSSSGLARAHFPRVGEVLDAINAKGDDGVGERRIIRSNDQIADPNKHKPTGNDLAVHLGIVGFGKLRQRQHKPK